MEIFLNILFLIIGFVILIKGADVFVEGASAAARLLKISPMIIGLTVVALGTSAPELAVSVSAALKGSNGIALGNVVGSNMLNLFLILALSAVVCPIAASRKIMLRDYLISVLSSVLLLVLGLIGYKLGRVDGLILLVCFIGYIAFLIVTSKKSGAEDKPNEEIQPMSPLKCVIFVIIGLAAVIIGSQFVVDTAQFLAEKAGMSETLIALTVIAFGTSLPELVTSVTAAAKKETDLALGNILGSNIFNAMFILGVSAFVNPIVPQDADILEFRRTLLDIGIFVIACALLAIPVVRKKRFTRTEGIAMIVFYAAYFAFIMCRNYGIIDVV